MISLKVPKCLKALKGILLGILLKLINRLKIGALRKLLNIYDGAFLQ